jgi:hypothetical protein
MTNIKSADGTLAATKRELDLATKALADGGAGNVANLECRLAELQDRMIASPAVSLADVATRLEVIRDLVLTLGPPGYLLHLVEATLADVRHLIADAVWPAEPGEGESRKP